MGQLDATYDLINAFAASENWKKDHDTVNLCRDIEEHIVKGIKAFENLRSLDAEAQIDSIKSGDPRARHFTLVTAPLLYRLWLDASVSLVARADAVASQGYEVAGLAPFQEVLEEGKCMVEALDFESEIRPIGELIAEAKPDNPNPARYLD